MENIDAGELWEFGFVSAEALNEAQRLHRPHSLIGSKRFWQQIGSTHGVCAWGYAYEGGEFTRKAPERRLTQVFLNKNFVKRDYECTNVVACVAEEAPNDNYIPADRSQALAGLTMLWIENGVQYYGYL